MPKRNEPPKKEWKDPKITSTPAPKKPEAKVLSLPRPEEDVVTKLELEEQLEVLKDDQARLETEVADLKTERDALAKRMLELENAPKGSEESKTKAELASVQADNRKYLAWIHDVQKTGIVNYTAIGNVLKK